MEIFLNLFIIFCIFVIGTLFGSFFTLATYRLPRHQDIVIKQSYCPNCKYKLGFFDLIPVLSYIIRGGKCKYCKDKISPRYILFELTNGCIFVIFYYIFGYTLNFVFAALIYAIFFVVIGSYIMSNKMSEEEKMEIKNLKENKLSKKAGVFVTEIIIAVILFVVLMVTSFVLSRNSAKINAENIVKSNANMIAVKNMEMCLATSYDELGSYNLQEKRGSTTYSVETTISKLSDQDFTKSDVIKNIQVKVSYMYDGMTQEVVLNSVKGRVL